MTNLLQDLVYGFRWLRLHPAFTVLSIATLAAGIGVNTAMFSVIHAVLLDPLPYPEADRIVWMNESGDEVQNRSLSYPNFIDWRDRSQSFEGMSLFRGGRVNLTGSDQPENIEIRIVSHDYFKVMRATPVLGRDFSVEEDQFGASPVTIISYGLWQRRFGGNPNIIGQSIPLDDKPHTIIGVMPPGFRHHGPPPLWLLAGQQKQATRDVRNAGNVIARLKPGVTLDQARAEINQVAAQLALEHPVANAGANRVNVVSLHENITGRVGWALKILFGAVGLVLLIACANVANLLLARAASRQKEFALRAALGASRWRIARQLLVESLMLAVTGGALGLLIAWWVITFLSKVAHNTVPRMDNLHVNYKVLAFNFGVSVLTGILFGMFPALRFSKVKLQETLKDGNATSTERQGKRLRSALIVAEVALSVALLVGAGLLVKSMLRLFNTNLGYEPDNVLTMELRISRNRYENKQQVNDLMHTVLERVKAQPGVQSATLSNNLPGTVDGWQNDISVEGQRPVKRGELINVDWSIVTPDYFKTMGMQFVRGRSFTKDEDERGLPVVVVDENLARRFWPNEDAIGKHIAYDSPTWHEIIGVVKEVRFYGSEKKPLIKIYTPFGRAAEQQRTTTLSVRSSGVDPNTLAGGIIREVHAVERDLPVTEVITLENVMAREVSTRRFNTWLFTVLAGLALVLAVTGVYGVISYSVARRTHEVGIRMALGAGHRQVLRLFIAQGMQLIVIGLGVGLLGSLMLTRLMSSLLFGVSTTDKTTFAMVALGLLVVGLLACYIPARRATKVDPLVALRYE
jgi:putative ABC transport system permease protein